MEITNLQFIDKSVQGCGVLRFFSYMCFTLHLLSLSFIGHFIARSFNILQCRLH